MSGNSVVRAQGDPYTDRAEIAKALGVTKKTAGMRARGEKWPFDETTGLGGRKHLYPLEKLPEPVRDAVMTLRAVHYAKQEAEAAPTRYGDDSFKLPKGAIENGQAKYQLYNDWEKFRRGYKGAKGAADKEFLVAYNSGQSHPGTFKIIGETSRTALFTWRTKLNDAGGDWRVLCDLRGHVSATGLGKIGPEAQTSILKTYLQPQRLPVAQCYRAMCYVLETQGLPIPSLRTTQRFIERYNTENADDVALARDGEKAWADKIGPYIDRDDTVLEVGDVLFADGHRLNFDTIHPFTGKPARLTLILWQDWASRMPLGWEVMPEENTVAIASALRMAIMRLGKIPKFVYIDNGKAFRSKYFTNTPADQFEMETRGLFTRLGIEPQYAKPYQARSKNIERFFGTFDNQCARLLPSYRGSSVADKPAYLMRNEKFHQVRNSGEVPTVLDTLEIFSEYVTWHGQQPHRGLDGGLPIDKFLAGRGRGVDVKQLDYMFMWRKEVHPRRCRVRLSNVSFEHDALVKLNQPLIAFYNWNDFTKLHLYTKKDHRFICTALPVLAVHPLAKKMGTTADALQLQDQLKRQARLKKQTMDALREIDAGAEALNIFPYVRRANEMVPIEIGPEPEPALDEPIECSDAERRAIEQVQIDYEARQAAAPPYERPDFFKPLDRYSHLFQLRTFEGIDLLPEDAAFMAEYEAGDEYQKFTHGRFDQLLELRAAQLEPEPEEEAAN